VNRNVRILIADDHVSIRTALRELLDLVAGIEVVGEATNGKEAVDMADRLEPDIVIMDVRMPRLDGIEATRAIKQQHPTIRVIAHSAYVNPDLSRAMAEAGAADFIIKGTLDLDQVRALAAEVG
jgi:DNA-binding NarL/FixJ family response regulator